MGRASWRYGHRRALALDQHPPQELAGHRPRQLVDDLDRGQPLVRRDAARRRTRAARPRSTAPRATTHAFGRSPSRSSGTPATAASATAGWLTSTASSSAGATWKPRTLISSLRRSTRETLAVLVDAAEVAGVQPAVGVDAWRPWRPGRRGSRPSAAARAPTPRRPAADARAVAVDARASVPAAACRRDPAASARVGERGDRDQRAGLGHAVALADDAAEPLGGGALERGGPAGAPPLPSSAQRREVVATSTTGWCASAASSGGATSAWSTPCVLHRAQHHLEVEARERDDRRAARRARGAARRLQAHAVEERREPEHPLALATGTGPPSGRGWRRARGGSARPASAGRSCRSTAAGPRRRRVGPRAAARLARPSAPSDGSPSSSTSSTPACAAASRAVAASGPDGDEDAAPARAAAGRRARAR